jgi:hypothetical protein
MVRVYECINTGEFVCVYMSIYVHSVWLKKNLPQNTSEVYRHMI